MQERATGNGMTGPPSVYEVGGQRFEASSHGFAEAIADAHVAHRRPRCMCLVDGVEMYVARLAGTNEGFIVKRMPNTGSHHAPNCPSYEPPPESSGLGAIVSFIGRSSDPSFRARRNRARREAPARCSGTGSPSASAP